MSKLALVSCDLNKNYLSFFPIVHLLWNKIINIPVKLVLISENIPEYLLKFKNDIILFKLTTYSKRAYVLLCGKYWNYLGNHKILENFNTHDWTWWPLSSNLHYWFL